MKFEIRKPEAGNLRYAVGLLIGSRWYAANWYLRGYRPPCGGACNRGCRRFFKVGRKFLIGSHAR